MDGAAPLPAGEAFRPPGRAPLYGGDDASARNTSALAGRLA